MQRYRLIREYTSHSMVPTPLCVITYPYYIIKYLYNLYKYWHKKDHSQTENEKIDSQHTNDKDEKGSKPRLLPSPPKVFGKQLIIAVTFRQTY